MGGPIYKMFVGKLSEAWHQLSQEEQDNLMGKVGEALDKVGGKQIVMCRSDWSSERWPFFGVEEFPDIEAVQKHSELLEELNWLRYVDSKAVLGTEWRSS